MCATAVRAELCTALGAQHIAHTRADEGAPFVEAVEAALSTPRVGEGDSAPRSSEDEEAP